MDHVWQYAFYTDTSTVTVHIRRLRAKLEPDPGAAALDRDGMGRRVPLRALAFAVALSIAIAGVVWLVYDDAPGALADVADRRRRSRSSPCWPASGSRVGGRAGCAGSSRSIAALGALQLAAGVALFVSQMFLSSHDAVMTVLLTIYAAALVAVDDAPARRARAARISTRCARRSPPSGRGRRDVRVAPAGDDEIARLGRQVDEMIVRLDREERMRRELFAAVSHDLRTPITSLGLLATAIDDSIVDEDKRREYAGRMNTHVRQVAALIDDLFDLTRLEAQELEWTMERLEVDDLVHDAVEAMRPAADAGSVAVRAHLNGSVACSHGNREQLSRVLFNLIQNAIHHTPPDGSVTVHVEDRRRRRGDRGRRHRRGDRRRAARPRLRAVLPRRRGPPGPGRRARTRDLARDRRGARRVDLARGRARRHARAVPAPRPTHETTRSSPSPSSPIVALALVLTTGGDEPPEATAVPALTVTRMDGRHATYELTQLASAEKPTLLWFWAPWCPVCNGEAPKIQQLAEQHATRSTWSRSAAATTSPTAPAFVDRHGLTAPTMLFDESMQVWEHYRIPGQPGAILLDTDGRERGRWLGAFDPNLAVEAAQTL